MKRRRSLTTCREDAPVLAGGEPRIHSGCSSMGRARPRHGRGHGFDPRLPLHFRVCPCTTDRARAEGTARPGCARGRSPCAARAPGRLAGHSRLDTAESGSLPGRRGTRSLASSRPRVRFVALGTFTSCSSRRPRTSLFQGGDTGSNPVHDTSIVLCAHAQDGNRPRRLGGSGTRHRNPHGSLAQWQSVSLSRRGPRVRFPHGPP